MISFNKTKKVFKTAFQNILKITNNHELDEAALPAYAHKNLLIDHLYWKRLKIAFDYAQSDSSIKKVLDFGCGSGVLSYLFANNEYDVTGIDIEFAPLNEVRRMIDFPESIKFIEGDLLSQNMPENSYDYIIAYNALEHIENLEGYIKEFKRILKPNGKIVVSGPTESSLYKLGRKLAGKRFTGDYHVTNIHTIRKVFEQHSKVKTLKRILFPIILFEIFVAE